jgi:hypothetical protein
MIVAFRIPDAEVTFSDEVLAGWAGRAVDVSLFGQRIGEALILSAENYVDSMLGPGVWVVTEVPESRPAAPFTLRDIRLHRLSTGVDFGPMTPDTNDTPEGVEDFTDEEQEAIIQEVPVPDDPAIPQPSQDPDDRAMDAEEQA